MNRGFRKSQKKHVNKMTHEQDKQSDDESDEDTVHVLSVLDSNDDGYWVTPQLENEPVRMQVDTGTRVSMISEVVYKEKLRHLALQETKLKLKTYTGESIPVLVKHVPLQHTSHGLRAQHLKEITKKIINH